ncbi:MAG: hypothetical protein ACFFAS_15240 [Promethearchaeota archaeon]
MEIINLNKPIKKTMLVYLVKYNNDNFNFKELMDIINNIKDRGINFATLDIADEDFVLFRNSPLPGLLKMLNIPYYHIKNSEETKKFYKDRINKIQMYLDMRKNIAL